jgi:hypothetical protein
MISKAVIEKGLQYECPDIQKLLIAGEGSCEAPDKCIESNMKKDSRKKIRPKRPQNTVFYPVFTFSSQD